MKKLSLLVLLIVVGLMGCSSDETQNYSFTSTSTNWDGEIQIEQGPINAENEDNAVILAEYTGNNSEALADETILMTIFIPGGSVVKDYKGLPEDNVLEFDYSQSDFLGTIEQVDPLEIQIAWQENGEEITESLFFEHNEE